ncbi:DNA-binding response regulator [Bacillus sp. M6-12]|uniref:response regulator n=1 Tax=Bacillus sp. M6-12 TaxID=2054166 RepID=UPI000C77CDED|nr:response regulator transcription factor [Bacillus sp. M6-12]PLS17696.1 DNA-binding response regulator [Bacillus sp. M6-12]
MIRIVIAEDQEMLLGAIGSLLNLEDDMEVVGQASNGEEALALVHRLQPDVCIMDIEMPKKSGLDAAEALKPFGCEVIIFTTFARTGYFQRALAADVKGYLLKDSPSEELASSIRSIMDGKRIYSPELIDDDYSDDERKIKVIELLAKGQTTMETSYQQSNTIRTFRKYFSTIIDKMKLPTG